MTGSEPALKNCQFGLRYRGGGPLFATALVEQDHISQHSQLVFPGCVVVSLRLPPNKSLRIPPHLAPVSIRLVLLFLPLGSRRCRFWVSAVSKCFAAKDWAGKWIASTQCTPAAMRRRKQGGWR